MEYIESFNKAGTRPYKLVINKFTDLTNEEIQASRNGYKICSYQKSTKALSFRYENETAVPTRKDWRKKGAVIGVKDQDQCDESYFPFCRDICSYPYPPWTLNP